MIYKYYLNSTLIEEPIGSENLVCTIKRDRSANGILITQDAQLTFYDDGYEMLKDALYNNSFCERLSLKIQVSEDEGNLFYDYFTGSIFIAQLRFDERNKTVKAKVQDNSYDAKINLNKSVQALLHVGRSKTDVAITACPYVTVTLFDVATGSDIAITAGVGNEAQGRMYRVYDALRFMIDFMADAEIGFESSLFDTGGEFEGLCISSGYMVKGYNGVTDESGFYETFPKLTYQSIINNLKPLNLFFSIENIDTTPKVRIEKKSYFEDSTTITASIATIDKIETYFSENDIYSSVRFGSGGLIDAPAYNFPETINLVGFNEEEFHTIGICNIDNTLDLSIEWTISSNAIQEAIDTAGLSSMGDSDVVMINCTPVVSGSTYAATKSDWLFGDASPLYYNEALNNLNTAIRYTGSIPSSIALFLGTASNEFLAKSTIQTPWYWVTSASPKTIEPVQFENDSTAPCFDDNGTWNTATGEYTCPSNGIYTFNCNLDFLLSNGSQGNATVTIFPVIDVYDSGGFAGGILLRSMGAFAPNGVPATTAGSNTPFNITAAGTVNLNAGEVAVLRLSYICPTIVRVLFRYGSTFGMSGSNTGGGTYQTYNPDSVSIFRHEFSASITLSQFNAIKANPKGAIGFSMDPTNGGVSRMGFIESLKYGVKESKFILSSSRNLNR